MKTISKFCLIIVTASSLLTSCVVRTGVVVRERPIEPVYYRPAAPYPGAIWIPGEWVWRDNHYVYLHGYYVSPHNRVWIEGHWRPVPGGYVWDRGHWRR